MGLDITAYRQLTLVPDVERDDDNNPVDCRNLWHAHPVSIEWAEQHFPGRSEGVVPDATYSYFEKFDFRAGSYGGYGDWRRELAERAGYRSADDVHKGNYPDGGPFYELINFGDNEGVIGPKVSAKLATDFQAMRGQVLEDADSCFVQKYESWQRAFEMAADGGAVDFA